MIWDIKAKHWSRILKQNIEKDQIIETKYLLKYITKYYKYNKDLEACLFCGKPNQGAHIFTVLLYCLSTNLNLQLTEC